MSGPIVRSGATPQFSENWDRIFGGKAGKKPAAKRGKKKPAKAATSAVAKSTKKKPAAVKKPAKKKGR